MDPGGGTHCCITTGPRLVVRSAGGGGGGGGGLGLLDLSAIKAEATLDEAASTLLSGML